MSETAEVGMVERMARAMCNELGVNPDDWHEEGGARTYAWQKEAGTARAALGAMREPTDQMLHRAFVAMNETPSGTWKRLKADKLSPRELFDAKQRPRFTAMIDAALQETDR